MEDLRQLRQAAANKTREDYHNPRLAWIIELMIFSVVSHCPESRDALSTP